MPNIIFLEAQKCQEVMNLQEELITLEETFQDINK